MFGASPVRFVWKVLGEPPPPAGNESVMVPPPEGAYMKRPVVLAPLGLMVPLMVSLVGEMEVADPVVTVGGGCWKGAEVAEYHVCPEPRPARR